MNPIDILKPLPAGTQDLAYSWVTTLFPDGPSPFGDAFAVFTSCLVFFGSLMLGWHILSGLVASAYSGKVLGERWHQIWAPLRVVTGFAMLIPVAGGFSSVHYLLRDVVAVAAINMGNAPITTFIESVASKGNTITPITGGGLNIVKAVFEKEICLGIDNNSSAYDFDTDFPVAGGAVKDVGYFTVSQQRTWDYGDCGSLYYAIPEEGEGTFGEARAKATEAVINKVRPEAAKFAKIYDTSNSAVSDPATVRSVLQQAGVTLTLDRFIATAAEGWNGAVGTAAANEIAANNVDKREELVDYIQTRGFMASGIYWRALSQMSARTAELASQGFTQTAQNLSENVAKKVDTAYDALKVAANLDRTTLSSETLASAGADEESVGYWFATLLAPITSGSKSITDYWVGTGEPSADPVGDMISFGHTLLNLVSGAFLLMITSAGGAGAAGGSAVTSFFGAGALLAMFEYASQWVNYALLIFLLVGLLQAYVLPMIPFIMVFMMGLGWLVLFLEAGIAVVIWAFVFIRMDGTEFVDQHQKQGVALLFNLLLRPALGMLALIGGMHLLPVLLNTLASLWSLGFYGQQGNSFVGLFGLVASLVIYCFLQWQICLRIFSMIPSITDKITHWSGLGTTPGYNEGQETDAVTKGMVGMAIAAQRAPIAPMRRQTPPPPPPKEDGKDKDGDSKEGGDTPSEGDGKKG